MDEFIIKLTDDMNKKSFLENVKVPILDGYHLVPNKGTLFTAISDNKAIEQFLCDGLLLEEETFEEHLDKVIESIKNTMVNYQFQAVENNISFLKDYPTKDFLFKVYQQDNIINEKICRQFNMFFMDKKTNAFYQLAYSTPPYSIKDMDIIRDDLTTTSIKLIDDLMNKVTY